MKENDLLTGDNVLSGHLANDTDALIAKIRPKIEENLERCYRDIHGNREYMFEVNATLAVKKPPAVDICPKNNGLRGRHLYSEGPIYICIYCGQDQPHPPKGPVILDPAANMARIQIEQARGERDIALRDLANTKLTARTATTLADDKLRSVECERDQSRTAHKETSAAKDALQDKYIATDAELARAVSARVDVTAELDVLKAAFRMFIDCVEWPITGLAKAIEDAKAAIK